MCPLDAEECVGPGIVPRPPPLPTPLRPPYPAAHGDTCCGQTVKSLSVMIIADTIAEKTLKQHSPQNLIYLFKTETAYVIDSCTAKISF